MNHIYRSIRNESTGTVTAVCEHAKSSGKKTSSGQNSVVSSGFVLKSVSVAVALALGSNSHAAPTGGTVVAGNASITSTPGNTTINQSSQNTVLNWRSFDVGVTEAVRFVQPNSNSVALNRVLGADPSSILGSLSANGKVFLINPNGILFGTGAQINVGGLVASTRNISDGDFLTGRYTFSGNSNAGILNQGTINADGGYVALLGANISNQGVIAAKLGSVALAAGDVLTLDVVGDGLLNVTVNAGSVDALVQNGGLIQTDGGQVLLTARSASGLLQSAVNNTGMIQAQTIANHNGVIKLLGSNVINSGTLDTSDTSTSGSGGRIDIHASYAVVNTGKLNASGAQGGQISVTAHNLIEGGQYDVSGTTQGGSIAFSAANHIEQTAASTLKADAVNGGGTIRIEAGHDAWLSGSASARGKEGGAIAITAPDLILAGARLDVSGDTGGGIIRIGGGWQGNDADLANANRTRVVDTHIDVSATDTGNGGTAVVWSEQETLFGGMIKATGGTLGGDGGQVEVSSHDRLGFGGMVDASAANGQQGRLLLDPKDIEIVESVTGIAILNLADPTPAASEGYGNGNVVELTNNGVSIDRIVIASSTDSTAAAGAGAVRLYNSQTGALLATLTGSTAGDAVGGSSVKALTNGNYVVASASWDHGGVVNVGAATWGSGVTGISGVVSAANSLIGSTANDGVGSGSIAALTNGNYVVASQNWDNGSAINAGAATWGNGATGTVGVVSAANSLVGSTTNDNVGASFGGVTALTNGNYVVGSSNWDNGSVVDAGAVTWGSGTSGIFGAVSAANSLVGSTAGDAVGSVFSITALIDGNYVVKSADWDNGSVVNAGAATWGSGTTGISGTISAANSLVGTTANDKVGFSVKTLANGNYVVTSYNWNNNTGAVTWGSGTTGVSGAVSAVNSLVGSTSGDQVGSGGIVELTNGNYVVRSGSWSNGSAQYAGAATWGSGITGVSGAISATNSLIGSAYRDGVSSGGVTALTNGNYVVTSKQWDNGGIVDVGAVSWGNGATGTVGVVSAANSLVGSTASDSVGDVTALTNGNYVVRSSQWDNDGLINAGAVTWGSGTTGIIGAVSAANSLVGSTANDGVGSGGVTALTNGNYVVGSQNWDNVAIANAGAVTWGNGATGTVGTVSAANSLVGSTASDNVGDFQSVMALTNGNYVVRSGNWDNGGVVDAGAVTWGNGTTGIAGAVSVANSLVGSTASDNVGNTNITALANGNYVVRSSNWDNGSVVNAGAVTWGNGATGIVGAVSAANSLVGSTASDNLGNFGVTALANGNYVVLSTNWDNGGVVDAGAVTWGSGTTGVVGMVSSLNSLVGTTTGDIGFGLMALSDGRMLVKSGSWDAAGLVNAGRVDIIGTTSLANPYTFAANPTGASTVLVSDLTALLNAGTAVTLQANNDITVSTAITANNGAGNGGDLTLQAGRSILLNASITTDNGNLTLTANDTVANGVVDANRNAGAAAITMAAGTSINAGTGAVALTLRNGAGLTNSTSGNIGLRDITAATISVVNSGPTAGSGIVLNGTLTASATTGEGIVLAGKNFVNHVGASALSTGVGSRWLVWSADPSADTRGSLAYDFKQYNATYGSTAVLGAGSGFLYTLAPSITASLTGTVSRTYDGFDTAALAANNYSVSGAVDGDIVTLNNPTSGTYDNKHVGTGKTVTVTGLAVGAATNGAAAVYGYEVASTSANNTIGAISQANLTLATSNVTKTYDGALAASGTATVTGGALFSTDSISGGTFTFTDKNAGSGNKTVTTTGVIITDGNGGGNYNVSYADNTTSTIDRAVLTAIATAADKIYDGNTSATATVSIVSGLVNGETLGATAAATFNSKDVASANLVTVNSVTLADGANGGLASNYSLATGQTVAARITPKSLTATAVAADKVYDGDTTANATLSSLTGLIGTETLGATAAATFNSKDVASANLVTVNSVTLADGANGGLASNYSLANGQTVAARITPKVLTVAGQAAEDKEYDGTTIATLTGGSLVGVVAGEMVMLNEAGTFATAGAGNAIAVTAADSLSGAAAANYTVTQPTGLVANITVPVDPEIPPVVTPPAAYENAVGHASNGQITPARVSSPLSVGSALSASNSVGSMTYDLGGLNLTVVDRDVSLPSSGLSQDTSDDDK